MTELPEPVVDESGNWPRPRPVVGDRTSAHERGRDPMGWSMGEAAQRALAEVIEARRDVRRFRPDELSDELVHQLLAAAHRAPSVGHSQPWRFIVVRERATRDAAAAMAERERLRQADLLEPVAAMQMRDLKLEGLREAPVGIVVCCDRRAEPTGVLGRATFHDADLWSCACAIENLWLTARAHGLGVGWVTLFDPDELARLLALPHGVTCLGWLCLGWPDERPPSPSLERAGWSTRLSLSEVVFAERWPGADPAAPVSRLFAPDPSAIVAARDDADSFLSSPSSLGLFDGALDRLSAIGIKAGFSSSLVLVAADHPVVTYGVSTYQPSVTREVTRASIAGEGLASALAATIGTSVLVVDAGLNGPPVNGAIWARAKEPRGDLVTADSLSLVDVRALIEEGRRLGADPSLGDLVCLGEVGIGNTTIAAALGAAVLGGAARDFAGLGAGGDTPTLVRKRSVIERSLARARATHERQLTEPHVALAALGGPEFALLAGVCLGAAASGRAIVLDGYATSIAALIACRLEPAVNAYLVASQESREQAHRRVLSELGLEAMLQMRLRAGEGIGALLTTSLLQQGLAARVRAGRVS
jgi:nicotinate-nucleotide--dimethylbenzimidazole phosphoribosyltransferase